MNLACTILESKVRCVRGEEGLRAKAVKKMQVAPVAGCQACGFGGQPKCAPNPDSAQATEKRARQPETGSATGRSFATGVSCGWSSAGAGAAPARRPVSVL